LLPSIIHARLRGRPIGLLMTLLVWDPRPRVAGVQRSYADPPVGPRRRLVEQPPMLDERRAYQDPPP